VTEIQRRQFGLKSGGSWIWVKIFFIFPGQFPKNFDFLIFLGKFTKNFDFSRQIDDKYRVFQAN